MIRKRRTGHASLSELNITPLLDLVFTLLVIFIISTPQLVNSLEMTLPSADVPPPPPEATPPPVQRIAVLEDGRIQLNDRPVDLDALRETLRPRRQSDPELAVVVSGSDEVPYQRMIDVLDVLQQLQIDRVGLATTTSR